MARRLEARSGRGFLPGLLFPLPLPSGHSARGLVGGGGLAPVSPKPQYITVSIVCTFLSMRQDAGFPFMEDKCLQSQVLTKHLIRLKETTWRQERGGGGCGALGQALQDQLSRSLAPPAGRVLWVLRPHLGWSAVQVWGRQRTAPSAPGASAHTPGGPETNRGRGRALRGLPGGQQCSCPWAGLSGEPVGTPPRAPGPQPGAVPAGGLWSVGTRRQASARTA